MTIREIAKIAQVSPAAISLVLNNKPGVGNEKREEILQLLEKLNYTPTQKKKSPPPPSKALLFLKFVKTGFLVEENAGFISKILDSIEKECSALKYSLRIQVEIKSLEQAIKNIDYSQIDGIFVIGTEIAPDEYPILKKIEVPYVVIDNSMPNFPCNSITMANEEMVHTCVQYLASLGQSSIGYFHSLFQAQNFEEREKGFRTTLQKLGRTLKEEHLFLLEPTLSGAYGGMKNYLERKNEIPALIFADNDTLAIGSMKALQEYGYRIPEDVQIIGFDDIYLSATSSPSLTTIHVQRTMIGHYAVMMLTDVINYSHPGSIKTRIGGSLVIRDSTHQ